MMWVPFVYYEVDVEMILLKWISSSTNKIGSLGKTNNQSKPHRQQKTTSFG